MLVSDRRSGVARTVTSLFDGTVHALYRHSPRSRWRYTIAPVCSCCGGTLQLAGRTNAVRWANVAVGREGGYLLLLLLLLVVLVLPSRLVSFLAR